MRKLNIAIFCLLLLVSLLGKAANNVPFYQNNSYFEGPYGYSVNEVRNFFKNMQLAIKNNDINWLSRHITYPLRIRHRNKPLTIKGVSEFKNNYQKIFNTVVKKAITCQQFDQLFVNSNGFMVGNGAVWFNKVYLDMAHVKPDTEGRSSSGIKPVSSEEAKQIRNSLNDKSKWAFRIIAVDDGESVRDFIKRSCSNEENTKH